MMTGTFFSAPNTQWMCRKYWVVEWMNGKQYEGRGNSLMHILNCLVSLFVGGKKAKKNVSDSCWKYAVEMGICKGCYLLEPPWDLIVWLYGALANCSLGAACVASIRCSFPDLLLQPSLPRLTEQLIGSRYFCINRRTRALSNDHVSIIDPDGPSSRRLCWWWERGTSPKCFSSSSFHTSLSFSLPSLNCLCIPQGLTDSSAQTWSTEHKTLLCNWN